MIKFLLPFIMIFLVNNIWNKIKLLLSMMMFMILSLSYSSGTMMNLTMKNFMISQTSSMMILLSIWICLMMLLSSKGQIKMSNKNPKIFTFMTVWLMITMYLVFSSNSLILFYIFFEMSLIPTIILIIMWGYQPERLQAGLYMMMYTITASLPLLAMLIMMKYRSMSNSIIYLMEMKLNSFTMMMFMVPILMAFMVKSPMFFFHLWLPKAHVEAPMAGSMILAGVLLKLGGYGLILMTSITEHSLMMKIMLIFALIGGLMSSFLCMNQNDMKSLIAYSSINHMALMIVGVMSNFNLGLKMSVMIMIAHGLCSSAMFMMSGSSFEKMNTRSLLLSKGWLMMSPLFAMLWFLMCMGNMGAPPTINLMSEIFLSSSSIIFMKYSMIILMIMILISGAYNMFLYTSINHGQMMNYFVSKVVTMKYYILSSVLQLNPIILLIFITYLITY